MYNTTQRSEGLAVFTLFASRAYIRRAGFMVSLEWFANVWVDEKSLCIRWQALSNEERILVFGKVEEWKTIGSFIYNLDDPLYISVDFKKEKKKKISSSLSWRSHVFKRCISLRNNHLKAVQEHIRNTIDGTCSTYLIMRLLL